MKEESKANLIERYIQGKLEDTELWEFKADMEKDADLAKEVKMRQEIYSVIKDKNKMDRPITISPLGWSWYFKYTPSIMLKRNVMKNIFRRSFT